MPELFFNTEIGSAQSIDAAVTALVQTADAYQKMVKYALHVFKERSDTMSICIVRDEHGFSHSFKDCVRNLNKSDLEKVMPIVYGLNKGTVIDVTNMDCIEEWVVDQIGAHSPLMECAARKNGMLLTVAVSECWKHDFFTFLKHTQRTLPNLWGQNDISSIEHWIEEWYKKNGSAHEEFKRRCDDVTLCKRSLPENDFSDNDWANIIEHFVRARERGYRVDDNLIKNLPPHATKYGSLYELRLHSDGIRVLFSLFEQKPFVGGYYRYGTGELKVRHQNSISAITRINAHG